MTSTQLREHIALRRLIWVGPLTIVSAAIANLIIRTIAVSIFGIPGTFQYLQAPFVIGSTIIFLLVALLAFMLVSRFSQHPIQFYRILAFVVLCISFLSPVMALVGLFPAPGMTLSIFWTMIAMHLVSAIIVVGLFTTLTFEPAERLNRGKFVFNVEEIKLKHEIWPNVLMLCGFGAAAIFLGLLFFAHLSPTLLVVASIAESVSIGVGSTGIGGRIAQVRRRKGECVQ